MQAIVTTPVYKVIQMPMAEIVTAIEGLEEKPLLSAYKKFCGDTKLPELKNNNDMLRRCIYHSIQERRYGRLQGKHAQALTKISRAVAAGSPRPLKDKLLAPESGVMFKRIWKGEEHQVQVVSHGYEYRGKIYKSLSGIAKLISGNERSGPVFFGIKKKKGAVA